MLILVPVFNRAILGENKPRIFLAYDNLQKKNPDEEPFHIALFVVSKDRSSISRRYDVMNSLESAGAGLPPRQVWRLRSKDAYIREQPLAGLLYLGKLSRTKNLKELEETFVRVAINNEDPKWRCRHWALDAIQALVREEMIQPISQSPEDIWKTGKAYTLAHNPLVPKPNGRVPICDVLGSPYVLRRRWSHTR